MNRTFRSLIRLGGSRGSLVTTVRVLLLRCLAIGVNAGTGILTATMLGPAGRGEQTAIGIAPSFLAGLATLGLHASFIYNVKAEPDKEREYLGANLIMLLAAGVVATAVGWVVEPYFLSTYSAGTIMFARLFLLTIPFTCLTWTLLGASEARGWFGFANSTLYLQSLCTLAALLILAWRHMLTPATAAATYTLPAIPTFLYFAWHVGRAVRPKFSLRGHYPRRLLHYGMRFYGIDLIGSLSVYLDQIVVVDLLAPGLVGEYSVALSLAGLLMVLQSAVSSVLFPNVAARTPREVVERVGATIRVSGAVTLAAVIVLAIGGPFLLSTLYGARFDPAVGPFRILLFGTLLSHIARTLYLAYSGSGKPEWVTAFEVLAVAVSATAMIVLVPHFGLIGAAASVVLASIVRVICAVAGLGLVLHVKVPRLVLGRRDIALGLRELRAALETPAASPAAPPDMHQGRAPLTQGVIICTYRRPTDLIACLEGLARQTRRPSEVIVVVRTTDTVTLDAMRDRPHDDLPVRVVTVEQPGTVAARNVGLSACRSDIVTMTDDDTIASDAWLERIADHFERDPTIAGVGGRDRCHDGNRFDDRSRAVVGKLQWFGHSIGNHHLGAGAPRDVHFLKGANMSFRSDALGRLRFDARLRGAGSQPHEDLSFSLAARRDGWRLVYDPAALVEHFPVRKDQPRHYVASAELIDSHGYFDNAYNYVLAIWSSLSPTGRVAYVAWNCAVGTRVVPGLVLALYLTRTQRLVAWRRFLIAQRAHAAAYRTVLGRPRSSGEPSISGQVAL